MRSTAAAISQAVVQERDCCADHDRPHRIPCAQRNGISFGGDDLAKSLARAHPNSRSLSISNLRLMPPIVTTAFAGRLGLSFSCPFETASRTAFSISRWAVTPNVLRNFRTLVLRASSSMIAPSWIDLFGPVIRYCCSEAITDLIVDPDRMRAG